MKKRYIFGSISHSSMRDVDLLDNFSKALRYLAITNKQYDKKYESIFKEAIKYRDFLIKYENKLRKKHHEKLFETVSHTVSYIIEDLVSALNEFAPPNYFFGSHPDDSSDYGFWLSEENES